jgi:ring-1,2-phenylacetyl-CoA epoxidase subunit PaaE
MTSTITLTIREKINETSDTVTLIFNEGFEQLPYKAGQFITIQIKIDNEIFQREYSLSSSPQVDAHLAITVKRVTNGKVSNYINDFLQVGEKISVLPALGNLQTNLNISHKRTVVLIAGGSGITPLFSIAKSILAIENNSKVFLLYANSHEHNIIFKNQLEELQQTYFGRFNHIHVISKPSEKWYGLEGRINEVTIIPLLEQLPVIFPKEAEYFICAPEGLMKSVQMGLNQLKIPAYKIKKESFGTNHSNTEATDTGARTLKIKYQQTEYDVLVNEGQTILNAANEANIDLPSSCKRGVCTACIAKCTSGKVTMNNNTTLNEQELNDNFILTCISYPLTDDVYIDFD